MRFLHTADWHVGKKLGRLDRREEVEAVLDELVAIARDREVDAVLVAGDLFDRASPPLEHLKLVIDTLIRLAEGRRAVVIPGNHDSPELFRVLAPLVQQFGIHMVHKPLEPDDGAIVTVPSRDGAQGLRVACLPFVHESQVVELMDAPEDTFKSYADRIRRITTYYADWMIDHPARGHADVLMGHFMVHGAVPSGTERELHIGEAYMATGDAIPPGVKYAALGHIHLPQDAPGSSVPARFSGSLMQLDFGEAGQDKSVCVVDVDPGPRPAQVDCIPLTAGRGLLKVTGTMDELRGRVDELGDAWLHVSVRTEGPEPGLADEVRAFLPRALQVHADYERSEISFAPSEDRSLPELYAEYHVGRTGVEPSTELMKALDSVMEEAGAVL